MLIKSPKLKVKKVKDEVREMLGKDGVTKLKRRIVNVGLVDDDGDFIKVTAFDPQFALPKEGSEWSLPPVKRLECFDGMVQEIMV